MIINHTYRFIFIHVPRCGGTSVSTALSAINTWQDLELGGTALGEVMNEPFRKRHGLYKHALAQDAMAILGRVTWNRYYKFALIRHPFERAISLYELLEWHKNDHPFMVQHPDFNHFMRSERGFPGPDRTMLPTTRWLYDEKGNLLVDAIYKLENVDMRAMVSAIGLPAHVERSIQVGQENGAGIWIDRSSIVPDVVDLMRKRYETDFQKFGYNPAWRW